MYEVIAWGDKRYAQSQLAQRKALRTRLGGRCRINSGNQHGDWSAVGPAGAEWRRGCAGRRLVIRADGRTWGCSSVGRAFDWQSKGRGFESPQLHQTS